MTERIQAYTTAVPIELVTPWALAEPPAPLPIDPEERGTVFGKAKLGLMYSGSFGMAHDAGLFLALARKLSSCNDIHFTFSVRGNRVAELTQSVGPQDRNISFIDFAPQDKLEARLGAPDIHLVSLRPGYEGTVVPSKFQGAIATGRPILYCGDPNSAIAVWIKEFGLGWTLAEANLDEIANNLIALVNDPSGLNYLKQRCFSTYQLQFSRSAVIDRLNESLKQLIAS